MGFATLRSGGTGRDRAFARALCFGDSTPLADFLRCLSDAARNVTAGCGTSRLAGIWTDGCFVAYGTADTGASSPSVDAFRSRAIISLGSDATRATNASESDLRRLAAVARSLAPRAAANGAQKLATADATAVASNYAWRSTVRVLAQCARDRAPAECLRCLQGLAMKDNPVFVAVCIVATLDLAAVLGVLVLIIRANKMKQAIQALEEEIAALEAQIKAVHLQLAAQTN
ncbi:hypothetical protein ACQ4PT_033260 [Festuca glaucescens]